MAGTPREFQPSGAGGWRLRRAGRGRRTVNNVRGSRRRQKPGPSGLLISACGCYDSPPTSPTPPVPRRSLAAPKSGSSKLCSTYRTRRHYRAPLGCPPAPSSRRVPPPAGHCSGAEWPKTTLLNSHPIPIGCLTCSSGLRPEGGHVLTLLHSGLHHAAHQSPPRGSPIGRCLRQHAQEHSGSCSRRRRPRLPAGPR